MSLDAVPVGISPDEVRQFLSHHPGVSAIHDLHIWPISTTETALTCHCVMPDGHPGDAMLISMASDLKQRFGIGHATIQIEISEDCACTLAPDHVV
jgi:cobalt-zinc-cadmium efflux system protein